MHQTVTESMLEFCLPRAGRRPLTLDLDLTGGNAERNFAAAGQYSMQWESFACELNLPLAFSIDDVQGKLPCLKKLRLDAYGTADSTSPPINAFFDAPQLREVDLDQITLPLISLPWAQLTDLKLWRTNAAEIVEMLRETRHLEKLTVHSPDPFSATPPTPLLLHHLHTLVLPDTSYLDLLDGINLPALEVLVLDWGTETALSALLGLFARSRCPLRSISMTDPSYSISLPIFEAIPSVNEVRLYLQDYPWLWDDGWLPFLQRLTTDAEFLPNLQTLDLEWDILTVPLELVEMLESRCHRRSDESKTLKALKVQCQLPQDKLEVDPDLVDRLRILVADGLTLELPPFYLIDGGVWTAA
ncbi:hypothetical protein B0H19DRAFT_1135018 [Mycena capillaripes]|nr:hypothetical protein B0H19DRAFT_1135018 [Mycena capillaripes]